MKITVTLLFVALSFYNLSGHKNRKNDLPNIIFFFTDDQAYGTQKDYGNPDLKTPNMDQLAKKGVVFLRHYNCQFYAYVLSDNIYTAYLNSYSSL